MLKHDATAWLFRRLQSTRLIALEITLDEWAARLLKNYQTKYMTDAVVHSVKFNIKNNLLWKNGEIDFTDSIYHEVFIPYDDPSDSQKIVGPGDCSEIIFRSLNPEGIHAGVTIRIFVVNGIIKLQIGKFSKSLSPDVTKKGLDVYKTFETITSFPLLYFSYQHRIPENYLNLSAYATDSWQRHQKGEKTDMAKDWKDVVKDVADYNYVCSAADEYVEDRSRWEKTNEGLRSKEDPLASEGGFH